MIYKLSQAFHASQFIFIRGLLNSEFWRGRRIMHFLQDHWKRLRRMLTLLLVSDYPLMDVQVVNLRTLFPMSKMMLEYISSITLSLDMLFPCLSALQRNA